MLKIYTKKGYINKLNNELLDMTDEEPNEVSMLEFYYDGLIDGIKKQVLPFVIKWNN